MSSSRVVKHAIMSLFLPFRTILPLLIYYTIYFLWSTEASIVARMAVSLDGCMMRGGSQAVISLAGVLWRGKHPMLLSGVSTTGPTRAYMPRSTSLVPWKTSLTCSLVTN